MFYFNYNDNLSQCRFLKKRTWTHGSHSHVVTCKASPHDTQQAQEDQRPRQTQDIQCAYTSDITKKQIVMKLTTHQNTL